MTLKEIKDYCDFISNKETSSNTFSPPEYNNALKFVNLDYFRNKYGLSEEYQPGRPIPKEAWEITKKITDDLRHLKVAMGLNGLAPLSVNQYGIAQIPSDYVHLSSWVYHYLTNDDNCSYIEDFSPGEEIRDDQIADRLSDSNKKPTKKYPVCVFYNNFIQFYPKDLRYVSFTYLRFPLTPVYDYYIDALDNEIYLPAGTSHVLLTGETGSAGQIAGTTVTSLTVELEIPAIEHISVARFLLSYIGINLRENQLIQYEEAMKTKGG